MGSFARLILGVLVAIGLLLVVAGAIGVAQSHDRLRAAERRYEAAASMEFDTRRLAEHMRSVGGSELPPEVEDAVRYQQATAGRLQGELHVARQNYRAGLWLAGCLLFCGCVVALTGGVPLCVRRPVGRRTPDATAPGGS